MKTIKILVASMLVASGVFAQGGTAMQPVMPKVQTNVATANPATAIEYAAVANMVVGRVATVEALPGLDMAAMARVRTHFAGKDAVAMKNIQVSLSKLERDGLLNSVSATKAIVAGILSATGEETLGQSESSALQVVAEKTLTTASPDQIAAQKELILQRTRGDAGLTGGTGCSLIDSIEGRQSRWDDAMVAAEIAPLDSQADELMKSIESEGATAGIVWAKLYNAELDMWFTGPIQAKRVFFGGTKKNPETVAVMKGYIKVGQDILSALRAGKYNEAKALWVAGMDLLEKGLVSEGFAVGEAQDLAKNGVGENCKLAFGFGN